ncbi:hypothetical protein PO909_027791 [Leuciscus waleckii]
METFELLSIQASVETFFKNDYKDSRLPPPPLLEDIPCCLRRLPFVAKRCRRGRKRRKRGGTIIRLKRIFGARNCIGSSRQTTVEIKGRKITWRSWEAVGSWLVPAIPEKVAAPGRTAVVRVYERRVNQQNLRPLCREQQTTSSEARLNMALLNVQAVGNKTFILNHFMTENKLDFLFLAETWMKTLPPALPGGHRGVPRPAGRHSPFRWDAPGTPSREGVQEASGTDARATSAELLSSGRASHPISKGSPSHPGEKAHFGHLYRGSCPFGHDPQHRTHSSAQVSWIRKFSRGPTLEYESAWWQASPHGVRPGSARGSDLGPPSHGLTTRRRDCKGPVLRGSGSSRRQGPRRPDPWTRKLALGM